jgi:hypothetical protein
LGDKFKWRLSSKAFSSFCLGEAAAAPAVIAVTFQTGLGRSSKQKTIHNRFVSSRYANGVSGSRGMNSLVPAGAASPGMMVGVVLRLPAIHNSFVAISDLRS